MANEIDQYGPGGLYHDTLLRDYETYKAEEAQRLGFQHDFAQAALKSAVFVNGGAIVSLFTFLGDEAVVEHPHMLFWSFGCFAVALGFALAAYFGAFFSQANYMNMVAYRSAASRNAMVGLPNEEGHDENEKNSERRGDSAMKLAIATSVLSLAGFAGGSFCALLGIVP